MMRKKNDKGIYLGIDERHISSLVTLSSPSETVGNHENIVTIGKTVKGRSFCCTIPFSEEEYQKLNEMTQSTHT